MATSAPALQLLGAERPRVELRPPAVYSLAGPAIELAARAGMVLEPWQAAIVKQCTFERKAKLDLPAADYSEAA